MTNDQIAELRTNLSKIARQVASIEKEATEALHQNSRPDLYRSLMRQKAEMLSSLYADSLPVLTRLPDTDKTNIIKDALYSFAANASTALQLDSVFYMSALLYPDDHVPGTPNNLELFIAEYL